MVQRKRKPRKKNYPKNNKNPKKGGEKKKTQKKKYPQNEKIPKKRCRRKNENKEKKIPAKTKKHKKTVQWTDYFYELISISAFSRDWRWILALIAVQYAYSYLILFDFLGIYSEAHWIFDFLYFLAFPTNRSFSPGVSCGREVTFDNTAPLRPNFLI